MKFSEDIENQIRKFDVSTQPEADEVILQELLDAQAKSRKKRMTWSWANVCKNILQNRTKLAAIIVIAIAGLIGIALTINSWPKPVGEVVEKDARSVPAEIEQDRDFRPAVKFKPKLAVTRFEQELESIKMMFAGGDIAGLVKMLDEGQWESKIASAYCLARIGDLTAIEPLEKLVAHWQGEADLNPFAIAIEAIEARFGSKSTERVIILQPDEAVEQGEGSEPATNLPDKPVLSGFITDAKTGEPVTDAKLRINGHISFYWWSKARTDQDGFYSFDKIKKDGDYRLEIFSNQYVGVTSEKNCFVSLRKDTKTFKDFELDKACIVKIRVIDEAGVPIKAARVQATPLGALRLKQIMGNPYVQKTGEDGLVSFGGFEPAETKYLISATHFAQSQRKEHDDKEHLVKSWDYAFGKLEIILNDPNKVEYGQIVLRKGVEVQCYVEYADGIPADGLIVSVRPEGLVYGSGTACYIVEPNGFFTLQGIVPGTYTFWVITPKIEGMLGQTIKTIYADLPLEKDELLFIDVPRKSPQSLATISGMLTFVGDNILEHTLVKVEVYLPGQRKQKHFERFEKNRGELEKSFIIDNLEPGTYTLKFLTRNFEELIIEDVEAPIEGLKAELVSAEKLKLKGIVISSLTGKPVSEFKLRARKLKTLRGSRHYQSDHWIEFSNVEGRFNIDVLVPGIYKLQIVAEGFASTWTKKINTDEDEDIRIELTTGGTIKGKVIDEQGQLLSGAVVNPLSKANAASKHRRLFLSGEGAVETIDGEFFLDNLPAGSDRLKISHPDYCVATVNDIKVIDGQVTEGIEIVLTKGGVVEGYVYDAYGDPEPNVVLSVHDAAYYGLTFYDEAGRLRTVITDSNGFYRAEKLPEIRCYVRRNAEKSAFGVVRRAIVPIAGEVSKLNFGNGPVLSGKIIVDGQPLAYEEISIKSEIPGESFWSSSFHGRSITAEDGSFALLGVPPGQYSVYLPNPRRRNVASLHAGQVEMGQQDTDIGVLSYKRDTKKE